MSLILDEIPLRQTIVDSAGAINLFFRLRWEQLRDRFTLTPTVANPGPSAVFSAAVPTTTIFTTTQAGRYLIGVSLKRATADGVSSSLQATFGWTQNGQAMTHVGRLLNTDSVGADPTDSVVLIESDANSPITLAVAYASNTPGACKYTHAPAVQLLA